MTEHAREPKPESMHPRRLETVVAQRPRCPRCNGAGLRKYRSHREQGAGPSLSRVRCPQTELGPRYRPAMCAL